MDKQDILSKIDLRSLAEQAGARFNNSNSSPCPLHRGDNRTAFHIYQDQAGIWRWHCFTNCQEGSNGGTAIDFYMAWRQVDFRTAMGELARIAGIADIGRRAAPGRQAHPAPPSNIGPDRDGPPQAWRDRAWAFCNYARKQLAGDDAAVHYLRYERGLLPETIEHFSLGYNPRELRDRPEQWGLKGDQVYLPKGIVIPHLDGLPHFVNIRRWPHADKPKYIGPRGGVRGLFRHYDQVEPSAVLLLVEGEFDCMLVWQWIQGLVAVNTMAMARARLGSQAAAAIAGYLAAIVVLDDDQAGEDGGTYLSSLSKRITVVKPPAHDMTDYWRAGGNLREWIAGQVVAVAERALAGIDEFQHPDLFVRWLDIYNRALEGA